MSDEDPFGTAPIRAAVLAAWRASPARFREDANAEEDLALGAYRDRVVVELAQNAADAAARAGVAGRLLLRLTGGRLDRPTRLLAANTGAPLDAAGVQALATLRASAKRDGAAVGRFGVGFAAVLGVSDEPMVTGRGGGVRFSAAASAGAVRVAASDVPELDDELARRRGHVPVLRLPWSAAPDGGLPAGYDTVVDLPLRDAAAERAVRTQLEALDDGLLLALPALDEIVVRAAGSRGGFATPQPGGGGAPRGDVRARAARGPSRPRSVSGPRGPSPGPCPCRGHGFPAPRGGARADAQRGAPAVAGAPRRDVPAGALPAACRPGSGDGRARRVGRRRVRRPARAARGGARRRAR